MDFPGWACRKFVETSLPAVDEAVLGRLRHAIDAEAGGEEEQLNGVLRMLSAIGGGVESVHGQPHGEDPQVARARQEVLAPSG